MELLNSVGAFFASGLKFEFMGIPVIFSSWSFVLLALFIFDAYLYIKKMVERYAWPPKGRIFLSSLVAALVILLSTAVHELAHGLVAYAYHIPIVKAGFTGWGAYVVPEIRVTDMQPSVGILLSAAGPLANLAIAGMAAFYVYHWPESIVENTVQYISMLNWRLFWLNMMPIVMLDGNKVLIGLLRMVLPKDASIIISMVVSLAMLIYLFFIRRSILLFKNIEKKLETL